MKSRLVLLFVLLSSVSGLAQFRGESAMKDFAAEMSVNAAEQERFFAKYPELKDEGEVVTAAARMLADEGVAAKNETAAATAVAQRAHSFLARRTPQEWQRKAVSLFPELGVAGSELNTLFLRHHAELQRTSPQFIQEPSWPVLLAHRCADELKARGKVAGVAPVSSQPAASAGARNLQSREKGFWSSLFTIALLLAIIVQPAVFLWRCSRAFAGQGAPVTLWQRALGPTAWAYLGVALIGLFRTFLANADQRFIDRFGVTLLVSLLAGLFFALPAYAASLAIMAWRRRPHSAATDPHV